MKEKDDKTKNVKTIVSSVVVGRILLGVIVAILLAIFIANNG